MPDDDDDKADISKWVYKLGDTEMDIDLDAEPMWTKAQADEWIDEISDLLSPSPRPMTWIDADVDDDDYRE